MNKMKELYEKVAADKSLQEKFIEIMKDAEKVGTETTKERLAAFAKDLGYEISVEEMQDFFNELSEKQQGELSDSELDMVAGGKTGIGIALSTFTLGFGCAFMSASQAIEGKSCKDYLNQ